MTCSVHVSSTHAQVLSIDRSVRTLTVNRTAPSLPSPVDFRLERREGAPALARLLCAFYVRSGTQVGYVRLSSFNARAQPDVAAALQTLREQGAEVFVLDLRDNRGGLVNQGVEVAKLFLNSTCDDA